VIAGVDGYKNRWVAAVDLGNGRTEIRPPCSFADLLSDDAFDLIVVDIPIGLPNKGARQADVGARAILGKRQVCVFPAPIRPILDCHDRETASAVQFKIEEKKVNVFQWAIVPKVRDVDRLVRERERRRGRIREGHPEVTFTIMNDEPLLSKKTPEGQKQRRSLLSRYFSDLDLQLDALPQSALIIDILDAYAMLWTARRIRNGCERRFPEAVELDPFGLKMEIAA
jgi:predicted RNase H-like nuclease